MIFGKIFGNQNHLHEEGKKLFELGVICASQYRCSEALDYYSKSISIHKNPAPYINRANLLAKRVRHFEALQDLLEAKRLDQQQANEFSNQINRELASAELMTLNYKNGIREKLIDDLRDRGDTYVFEKILCSSFNISASQWEHNTFKRELIEYHFFNEIDNIQKFEERNSYPDASEFIDSYPSDFIQKKLTLSPNQAEYKKSETFIQSFLCSYDEYDMQRLRNLIIYEIHCKLLERDYGGLWMSLSSDCEGVTREAADFIASQS